MHGFGFYRDANKTKYDGQFVADKKQGYGIYTWPDGRKYAGWWHRGKKHGFGIETKTSAETTNKYGIWDKGKRV